MVHLNSWARGLVLTTCALAVAQCGGAPEDNVPARDDSPVVAIPSGEFDMGGRFEDVGGPTTGHSMTYQAERPLHRVRISGFNLDEHEVTVGQYRTFLTYLSASGDSSARHPDQPPEVDHTSGHTADHRAADHPSPGSPPTPTASGRARGCQPRRSGSMRHVETTASTANTPGVTTGSTGSRSGSPIPA